MRNLMCYSVLSLFFFTSYIPQKEMPLTNVEKESLKYEESARINYILQASNNMDIEAVRQIYWDNPNFSAVSMDKLLGYEAYMKDTDELWSGMKSISFDEKESRVSIFNKDTAYAIFSGAAEGTSSEGVA